MMKKKNKNNENDNNSNDEKVDNKEKVKDDINNKKKSNLDEIDDEEDEDIFPLLNSFYIKDIERAIYALSKNEKPNVLLSYLSESNEKEKTIDLLSQKSLKHIIETLSVDNIPKGRWPSKLEHNMSLMQQFAINTFFNSKDSLISVNGPPGTGKTTLLRDIVANNIVLRAIKLSKFDKVKDTITGDGALHDSLTGFEMVVASSNNGAVENISKELPLKSSISIDDFPDLSYIEPTANQINASYNKKKKRSNNKLSDNNSSEIKTFKPMGKKQYCWGAIAAVLGNSKNRFDFKDKYFYDFQFQKNSEEEKQLPDDENYLNFWRWYQLGKKISFSYKDANENFKNAIKNYDNYLKELKKIENKINKKKRFWFISKLFNNKISDINKFPNMSFPEFDENIDDPNLQLNAFWQNKHINKLRSELFYHAMILHESWIKEIVRINENFRNRIYELTPLITGKKEGHQKELWNIFFMIVPVVSTTFASFASTFKNLYQEDIGYLFIDEAGQAIPQASIGAMWRAKKTLVIGDPIQIEPVFTTPCKLIEYFSFKAFGCNNDLWNPNKQSIQTIADRTNTYKSVISSKSSRMTIGIPLRIHRRCGNPMFEISNVIAYEEKMIHCNLDKISSSKHNILGESAWIDVKGLCLKKHYVEEQGEILIKILNYLIEKNNYLPDLFIITPFKRIKENLKKRIKEFFENNKKVNDWIKKNVGTVHTFQGKESKTVIFVLGCDEQAKSKYAVEWACNKPNLFNVALTRAKSHFFIIGNSNVWHNQEYFTEAYAKLKKYTESEFINTIIK